MITRRLLALLLLVAVVAGCGGGDPGSGGLAVTDPWAKAAEEGMTGVFGTLVNDTGADIHVVSAASAASARAELHTTAMGEDGTMVMRETEDGFVVPAHGDYVLEPGADHVMLMDLVAPLAPGDEVTVELTTADGDTVELVAQVRTFAGGMEEYEPGDG